MQPPLEQSSPKQWTRCFIGLGSNLDNPQDRIQSACEQLGDIRLCRREKVSSFYISAALRAELEPSYSDQPDYINAVAELFTQLSAEQLLDELQIIEQQHGRTRSHRRWQSRTLDLDILLFGSQQISSERLRIPHPEMLNRNFVVLPLSEIAEDLMLPCGQPLQSTINSATFEPLSRVGKFHHKVESPSVTNLPERWGNPQ